MFFFCFCFFVFVFLVFFFCFLRREFVLYLFFFLESTRYRVPRIVIIRFYVRLFWEVSIYIVLIDDFIEWYTMWYRVVFVFFFFMSVVGELCRFFIFDKINSFEWIVRTTTVYDIFVSWTMEFYTRLQIVASLVWT